jgi:hypothetical protein
MNYYAILTNTNQQEQKLFFILEFQGRKIR